MKTKKIIFATFASMVLLFFTSCENGVSFDPTEIPGGENGGEAVTPIVFTTEVENKGIGYRFNSLDGNYVIEYIDLLEASSKEEKTVSFSLSIGNLKTDAPITVKYISLVEKSDASTSFIGAPTFNEVSTDAATITSDAPTVLITVALASNPSIEQTETITLTFNDESGTTYDTDNSPKEIKIDITRNKYEEITDTVPRKFAVEVTPITTDYLFNDVTGIEYIDSNINSSKEEKTVSIKLALGNLHEKFPVTVEYTKNDENDFIGTPVFTGYTTITASDPTLQIDIPLAANSGTDQAGVLTLKFSGGSIYTDESPKEINIPIKRNKYTEAIENGRIFSATVGQKTGTDYSFSGSDGNYVIEYTDTIEASTQEKTVSIELTLGNLHDVAPITVESLTENSFITAPAVAAVTATAPTLQMDIPLAPSTTTNQEGTLTLNFTDASGTTYDAESLSKEIKITIKRNKYIAPVELIFGDFSENVPSSVTVIKDASSISIADEEGNAFTNNFKVITFPDITTIPSGNRVVVATIEGATDDFFNLHFCVDSDNCDGSGTKTFTFTPDATATLRVEFIKTEAIQTGTASITFNYDTKVYKDTMPKELNLNLESQGKVDHKLNEYVDNFAVSSIDEGKLLEPGYAYYTEVRIPGNTNSLESNLTYEIFRKDDSSTEFKLIDTRTIPANDSFAYRDYHAFILRNPIQEYKIAVKHDCGLEGGCSAEIVKEGSRYLTNRELALAVMDSMRYALIDKNVHRALGTVSAGGGTFKHMRWYLSWQVAYGHGYEINNYKPYFITLGSSVDTNGGRYFQYVADGGNVHTINTQYWTGPNLRYPFKGTVTFTSPFGKGSITFNNVHINNNTWSNPSWASGTLTVDGDGWTKAYDKNSDIPFGFYMESHQLADHDKLNKDNYTQK